MKRQRFIIIVIVLLFTAIGMYLRFDKRLGTEIRGDEPYQISGMKTSLAAAIIQSRDNLQFPGDYILIYPFYRLFGENKWGLAIPHIIVTIIGFYLLYILCRKYLKTVLGYAITFAIFAYNYTLINHAFEIRPYSLMVTISLASFLVMQYIFENEDPPLINRFLVGLFIFVSIFTSLFGSYVLIFNYIFHLFFSRKEKAFSTILSRHLKHYSFAVILAIPFLYLYLSGTRSIDNIYAQHGSNTFEYIQKGIIPILKGVFGNLTGRRIFYFLLPGLIINLFIPHQQRLKQCVFFVVLVIVPIGILLLACIYYTYWFIQRLFIWAIPPFAFLLGWIWESITVYVFERFKKYNVWNLRNS